MLYSLKVSLCEEDESVVYIYLTCSKWMKMSLSTSPLASSQNFISCQMVLLLKYWSKLREIFRVVANWIKNGVCKIPWKLVENWLGGKSARFIHHSRWSYCESDHNAGLMWAHRLWRWPNIKAALRVGDISLAGLYVISRSPGVLVWRWWSVWICDRVIWIRGGGGWYR